MWQSFLGVYMIEFYRNLPKFGVIWITVRVFSWLENIPKEQGAKQTGRTFPPLLFFEGSNRWFLGEAFFLPKKLFLKHTSYQASRTETFHISGQIHEMRRFVFRIYRSMDSDSWFLYDELVILAGKIDQPHRSYGKLCPAHLDHLG